MMDKEIIKILNTATNIDGLQICCIDYENDPETKTFLSIKSDVVDLINRQQAEIERLSKKNEELAEILSDTIRIRYAECKAEAIKEFAERLKEKAPIIEGLYFKTIKPISCATIDNLVKEMVGEDK